MQPVRHQEKKKRSSGGHRPGTNGATKRRSFQPGAWMAKGRVGRVGIATVVVDGRQVAVTAFDPGGGRVESYRVVEGSDAAEAFRAALLGVAAGAAVRVIWGGVGVHVAQATIPRVPPDAVEAALAAAGQDLWSLPEGSLSVGGRVLGDAEGGAAQVLVTAVETALLAPMWTALRGRDASVIAAPMALRADGLYLGVRHSTTEFTFVANGAPIASRLLSAGGLGRVVRALEGSGVQGPGRLEAVLRGLGDPDAMRKVDDFVAGVADEVERFGNAWVNKGFPLPQQLYLHGPGAALASLGPALADKGFQPVAIPAPPGVDLSAVDERDRPAAVLGVLGAAPLPAGTITIPDVADLGDTARRRARLQRVKLFTQVGMAVAALVALALLVLGVAAFQQSRARHGAAAQIAHLKELAATDRDLATVQQGSSAIAAAVADEPSYPVILGALRDGAPPGTSLTSITASTASGGTSVNVKASVAGSDFTVVAGWLRALAQGGGKRVWATRLSQVTDHMEVELTVTYPNSARFAPPRPALGAQP